MVELKVCDSGLADFSMLLRFEVRRFLGFPVVFAGCFPLLFGWFSLSHPKLAAQPAAQPAAQIAKLFFSFIAILRDNHGGSAAPAAAQPAVQ